MSAAKRPRMEENAASSAGEVSSSTSGEASGGNAGAGAPIFAPGKPLKLVNTHTKTFTKKFYFKIYANDWIIDQTAARTNITHFGTIIPYHALCMYLSPQEYMEIVRGSHYAKVDTASLELKFKAIRTPFDANSTDAAEANGNLQFEIQRWDGLEHMLPFQTVDLEGRGTSDVTPRVSYLELITRLYGRSAFANPKANFKWPATMRERGLSWRPQWRFDARAENITNPKVGMYREINQYISSLPVGEYISDSMNTNMAKMSDGYCFNKTYKPTNGLLAIASSAVNTQYVDYGRTRVNVKTRFQDSINNDKQIVIGDLQYKSLFGQSEEKTLAIPNFDGMRSRQTKNVGTIGLPQQPALANPGQELAQIRFSNLNGTGTNTAPWDENLPRNLVLQPNGVGNGDDFGFGYNNEMAYYSVANLENYDFFGPSHDPPVKHMPSMIIGIVPKTNSDDTIVKATAEFECTTSITISCEDTHPTYVQCAFSNGWDGYGQGYVDDFFNTQRLYGGRWQHNEKEVSLRDNKYWAGDYGLAGKPVFRDYPINTDLL